MWDEMQDEVLPGEQTAIGVNFVQTTLNIDAFLDKVCFRTKKNNKLA